MKIVTSYIITERDKELLNNPFPENPCSSCKCEKCNGIKNSCSAYIRYNTVVKTYEDENILQYATKLRDIRHINAEINKLLSRVKSIIADIPPAVIEVLNDEIYGWPKNVFGKDINNV